MFWGFKDRIRKWFSQKETSDNIVTSNTDFITKRIGDPNSIEKDIQHYNSRERIHLKEILDNTKESVGMSALTFTIIAYSDLSLIEQKLNNGIKFTFILSDTTNSKIIDRHKDRYPSAEDLKNQIENTLIRLCNLKNKFENKLTIKINTTDNFDNSGHGLILLYLLCYIPFFHYYIS